MLSERNKLNAAPLAIHRAAKRQPTDESDTVPFATDALINAQREYTARPKHERKIKYPWIRRRMSYHARSEIHIRGTYREVVCSDIEEQVDLFDEEQEDLEDRLIAKIDTGGPEEKVRNDLQSRRLEFLEWAMSQLTEKQTVAIGIYFHGGQQTEGASLAGISQPAFRERIFGKDGKGGAINKLRKLAAKYPIPLT